jgi:iron-sulfur cluster assembly accessory protein
MITITDTAAKKILESVREAGGTGDGLRVRVVGGGCSGLQYKMAIDSERKGDKVFEHAGAKLYVDRKSYLYLNGTQLDYAEGLMNVGFRLDNPNVKRTCGCGESFSV